MCSLNVLSTILNLLHFLIVDILFSIILMSF